MKLINTVNLLSQYFLSVKRLMPGALFTSVLVLGTPGCTLPFMPLAENIDLELGKAIDNGFDGIIVHVDQAGKSESYAAGWNDRDNLVPAKPNNLFKIASISKLYVAAATTMLVADGVLSLDETLDVYLPQVANQIEHSQAITLRMLLQHRSGIADFIHHPDYANITNNDDTYSLILDKPAEFKPGKKYRYSNSNYFLIGEILDEVLGRSHHKYIHDEILAPLELSNTYSLLRDVELNQVMKGYLVGVDDGDPFWRWEHLQPSGSMVASAQDVAVFVKALVDGSLLTPQEQNIYSSVYEYEHTGWLPGYTSIVRYHSDIDAVVVMFVNTSHNEFFWLDLERVYGRIVRVLKNNPL